MNLLKIRKYLALGIMVFLPAMLMMITVLIGAGVIMGLIVWGLTALISIVIFSILTRHPIQSMIYGDGLLTLTLDSTGVIQPFLCRSDGVFVSGQVGRKRVSDLFDRNAVSYLRNPIKAIIGKLNVDTKELEKNKSSFNTKDYDLLLEYLKQSEGSDLFILKADEKVDRTSLTFGFGTFPCLIYNKSLDTFLTKDVLASLESEGLIRHTILYLKKKAEELSSIMRDFARTVVELSYTKNKLDFVKSPLFWLIIAIGAGALIVLFWPQISQALGGGSAGGFLGGAVKGAAPLVGVK